MQLDKSCSAFLLLAIVALAISAISVAGCPRGPTNLPHARRTRGDNGYKLIVADGPNGYVPGKTYNLLLLGSRTHSKVQHFTHFTITAEAHNGSKRSQQASPRRVGRFQLFSDALSKFHDRCVNTVSEADDLPKTEIQVMWVAPEAGSGCVSLSAMVYESPRAWFSDDGQLTQVICEKRPDAAAAQKECCACDEAKYSMVFEGIWSNETHPRDYPFAIWLTHFSDVIGASHESNFSFWGENHIATDGFRSLAEWGSPTALEAELRAKGPRLRTLIKAAGLWYPSVNTNTSAKFRVDRKHPKLSLVSMFGPSPDWVVGISGVDMCTEDCSWKDSMDFDLYPWDAGTDSGITYMSPNTETQPRERMYRITNMYPEDPRAPFYNPSIKEMTPLAKLYIRREKIVSRNCDDDFLQALQLDVSDDVEEQDTKAECRVTPFTEWSPCSVSCGKGIRMRSRQYYNPQVAEAAKCARQLVAKEMCVAAVAECSGAQQEDEDEGEILANSQSLVNDDGEGAGVCKTTPWSVWSDCSASCGIGITMRTRTFINHLGRKRCPHISIVEKQKCMLPDCTYEQVELPDRMCPTTQWSDWSPCTATCGRGVTIRTRLVLLEDEVMKIDCSKRLELHQQKECTVSQDCSITKEMAKDICMHRYDTGPCRGYYTRYAYNKDIGRCETFIYGGCRGNRNNFLTENDCLTTCGMLETSITTSRPTSATQAYQPYNANANDNSDNAAVDCVMSDWTDWSECSVSCGLGYSERRRYIISEAKNGGLPCPKRTKKRRCTVTDLSEICSKISQPNANEAKDKEQEKETQALASAQSEEETKAVKVEEYLNITSEQFNPLRALYANDFRVSQQVPRVQYQNLAAFESAFKKVGIWNLNKRDKVNAPHKTTTHEHERKAEEPAMASCSKGSERPLVVEEAGMPQRRFLPHQMAIRRKAEAAPQRHRRNLYMHLEKVMGPLSLLRKCVAERQRVHVRTRRKHGIRGTIEGCLLCFDKHWNLLLSDVSEVWHRRKYKYGENKSCGEPQDCTQQLRELGIQLPEQQVKSLNRKNVEIRRELKQLLVRGEQVVLVTPIKQTGKTTEGKG